MLATNRQAGPQTSTLVELRPAANHLARQTIGQARAALVDALSPNKNRYLAVELSSRTVLGLLELLFCLS